MKISRYPSLYRRIVPFLIFVFVVTSISVPAPAVAADVEAMLNNPETVDPFKVDVPQLREDLFEYLAGKEQAIIERHVQETGIPWRDSSGKINKSHPRYKQATREFAQMWEEHLEKVQRLDASMRERGINQVLDRAKALAAEDGVKIDWNKEFRSSGTDPWKGRGTYTDAEYTGTDRANRYFRRALQEKNLKVKVVPGQNSIEVKSLDLMMWGEEGPGKIHRAFEAGNPQFAKSASPLRDGMPIDKGNAALETMKKAHLDPHTPAPGSWEEYQRICDLAKAVERGQQNVLGKSPTDGDVKKLHGIRTMETDPVSAGLRDLGERGLQNPKGKAFQQEQLQRLSEIMKAGEKANQTFVSDLNQQIQQAEAQGDFQRANELKLYKNQSLQQQILQRKQLINQLGQRRYAEIVEGTEFTVVRDPKEGTTMIFRNTETGETLTKLDMIERYRNVIKRIEANRAAGKTVTYKNPATNQIISEAELLERARGILKNLEEGKYAEALKLTEYEPTFQRGKGVQVRRAEYEIAQSKGKGGQTMYRNTKTGETITEAEMQKRYLRKPVENLRKGMSDMGNQPKASFAKDDFSFKGLNEKAFQPFKTMDLPTVKEGVFPPSRAKNIKLVHRYAKVAEKFFRKQYPQLGTPPKGAFWLADPTEALEEYLLEAEGKMSRHPEILRAFKAVKRDILKHYVRTHLQHQRDAFYMAQEEYVKVVKERPILRARKMARDAQFNESLMKMMLTLLVASKLVDFLNTWYDEGFDGLARKSIDFLTVEVPTGVAITQGLALLIPYLAMNYPVAHALVISIVAYLGAYAVGAMVFTIGGGITYMTTDYFLLDENRQTLIRSLCPWPPKKTNLWDIWTWLSEKRGVDIEKDVTPLVDALLSPNTKWSTTMTDIEEYSAQLVRMYRIWLLENYDYIRRLRYFEDDPKVWDVITNELAKRIWLTNHAITLQEEQKEVARKQIELEDQKFAERLEEVPRARHAVIYEIRINGNLIENYFADFRDWLDHPYKAKDPLKFKPGDVMKVDLKYVVFGLPDETLKVNISPFIHEGYVAATEEESLRGTAAFEGEVHTDEEFGMAFGTAQLSIPLQYPSQKQFESKLIFNVSLDDEDAFRARLYNVLVVESPPPSFVRESQPLASKEYLIWVQKRGNWCMFETGDRGQFQALDRDNVWHKQIAGPFDDYHLADARLARMAKAADSIYIIPYGLLYFQMVGPEMCFFGRVGEKGELRDLTWDQLLGPTKAKGEKVNQWVIYVNVIDQNSEGIPNAEVYSRKLQGRAANLGGGRYKFGPIPRRQPKETKAIDITVKVNFRTKGAAAAQSETKTVQVTMADQSPIGVVLQFSRDYREKPSSTTSDVKKGDEASGQSLPSFVKESKNKPQGLDQSPPSFVKRSNVSRTNSGKPAVPVAQPPSKKIQPQDELIEATPEERQPSSKAEECGEGTMFCREPRIDEKTMKNMRKPWSSE